MRFQNEFSLLNFIYAYTVFFCDVLIIIQKTFMNMNDNIIIVLCGWTQYLLFF